MRLWSLLLALSLLAKPTLAVEVDYLKDIQPLLAHKCAACHGAIKQESGLRLDAGQLIHHGGDSGKVIDLDQPDGSELLHRVSSKDADVRMPPTGEGEPLKPAEVQLLRAWIAAGAKYPEDEQIPLGPDAHWAYRVPVKADIPKVDDPQWSANPIDAFIFAKLKSQQLQPAPPADRHTLLRRAYLNLVGLPPTAAQQQAFLADESDEAWAAVVDRLLDDPAYGERWGRHWMDVWRYSDWDGYKQELRGSQRHIWRWRDWIIESLNDDKPYDRMIVEMLAADEAAPEDRDVLRATGYLARNYHKSNRNIWLDATVEHTAKAFLGMTINCARCHDHKYDPISQTEYYAMRAIFEPHNVRTERVPGVADTGKDGLVRAFDAKLDEPTYLYIGGNEKSPDKAHPLSPAVPSAVDVPFQPQTVDLPPVAVFPALRDFYEAEALAAARGKLKSHRDALAKLQEEKDKASEGKPVEPLAMAIAQLRVEMAEAEVASVESRWQADKAKYGGTADAATVQELAKAASTAERTVVVKQAQVTVSERRQALDKANESKKQAAIDKAKKELADAEKKLAAAEDALGKPGQSGYKSVGQSYPAQSTGRRLALAKWITDQRNPLTARVAVNQIWLRHFGEPLVENVFDFGMRSPEPVHRELLDWLAVELMENDWSMKHLHRLIVTSRHYRSASVADSGQFARNRQLDPDNRLLWKANVRRLDAEVVRDSLLHIGGTLDQARGGPDIDHGQGATTPRRSLYFRHAYEKQMRMLVAFDAASPGECYRRSESVVPQQALALSNGPLAIEQSRILADKLTRGVRFQLADDSVDLASKDAYPTKGGVSFELAKEADQAFIRAAFAAVLCRDCSDEELTACSEFLATQEKLLAQPAQLQQFGSKTKVRRQPSSDPAQRARENLIHVLINHNDFVTLR